MGSTTVIDSGIEMQAFGKDMTPSSSTAGLSSKAEFALLSLVAASLRERQLWIQTLVNNKADWAFQPWQGN